MTIEIGTRNSTLVMKRKIHTNKVTISDPGIHVNTLSKLTCHTNQRGRRQREGERDPYITSSVS